MDLSSLKLGFFAYLEELNEKYNDSSTVHYDTDLGEISLFIYANEFKEYLRSNNYADSSIMTKSVDEILQMEIVDGHLVDPADAPLDNDTFETGTEPDEQMPIDEAQILDFLDAVDDESSFIEADDGEIVEPIPIELNDTDTAIAQENDSMADATIIDNAEEEPLGNKYSEEVQSVLDEIYENENAQEFLDLDGDGEISEEEKETFENYVQGENEELTVENLEKVLAEIEEGIFEYNPEEEETTQVDTDTDVDTEETEVDETEASTPDDTPAATSTNNGGGGGGGNYYPSTKKDPNDIKNMTLDQLKSEKSKRQSNVDTAKDALNAVYNGTNDKVATAKKDYDTAKEAYEEALKNDKNVSQETKEEQAKNIQEIETANGELDKLNTDKNNTEREKTEAQNAISADEANIAALKEALSSLQNASPKDDEEKAAIAAKISSVQNQITTAENQKSEHEKKLKEIEEKLSQLETKITEQKKKIEELEKTREKIDEKILATCSEETKTALQTFNDAKDNVESTKESEAKIAEKAVSDAEKALSEVDKLITEKEARKTKQDNSYNDFSKAIDWARQYDDYSEGQIRSIFKELGYQFDSGLWCADFVRMVLGEAIGDENLPEWYQNVTNKAYCPTVQKYGEGHQVSAEEAQAGDIVLFDWDGDGSADHIGLFVDNGDGTSTITTIEGNTYGKGGSSCVEEQQRKRGSVLGIYSMRG